MTFIDELDPYTIQIYQMCGNELPTFKAFKSYHITDRQTDMAEIIYHSALWMVKNDTYNVHFSTGSSSVLPVT